ncbi:hypothetical protein ACFL34_00755 [Candidatus Sumerlaeota bacterium]
MNTNEKRSRSRRRLALIVAVVLAATVAVWLANRGGKAPEMPPVEQADCGRFLFIENKGDNSGRLGFHELVQVRVTLEGFEQQRVRIKGKLPSEWQPLCVIGSKVYGRDHKSLLAVDLQTGAVETICAELENVPAGMGLGHYYADGKLYAVVRSGGKPTMRVFDLRRRFQRDIAPFKVTGSGDWPFAISPDHQRVAYFVRQPSGPKGPIFPPAWLVKAVNFVLRRPAPANQPFPSYYQLNIIYTDTGESEELPAGATYSRPPSPGHKASIGPSFLWLDAKTILCESEKLSKRSGANQPRNESSWLTTIDVTTDELDDLVAVPRYGAYPQLTLGSFKRTVSIQRHGGDRSTLDLADRKLAKGRASGDHYRLTRENKEWSVLSCDGRPIARSSSGIDFRISPNGRRVLWITLGWSGKNRVFVDGEWVARPDPGNKDEIVQYHAVGEESARIVAQTQRSSYKRDCLLWYTDEDLEAAPPAGEPPEGWLAFPAEPTRKNSFKPRSDYDPKVPSRMLP